MSKKITINELLAERPMSSWKVILLSTLLSSILFYGVAPLVSPYIPKIIGPAAAVLLTYVISFIIVFGLSAITLIYIHRRTNLLVHGKTNRPPPADQDNPLLKDTDPRLRPFIKIAIVVEAALFPLIIALTPYIKTNICNGSVICAGSIVNYIFIGAVAVMATTVFLMYRKIAQVRHQKIRTVFIENMQATPNLLHKAKLRMHHQTGELIKSKNRTALVAFLLALALIIQFAYILAIGLANHILQTSFVYILGTELSLFFMLILYDYELSNLTKNLPSALRHRMLLFGPKDENPVDFIPSTNTPADVTITVVQNLPKTYYGTSLLVFYMVIFSSLFLFSYNSFYVTIAVYIFSLCVAHYKFKIIKDKNGLTEPPNNAHTT